MKGIYMDTRKTVAFHNLGCKVNTYELDAVSELFTSKGYETVAFDEKADYYVVNTCSVTNIADRKSRQMLSRAKKNNPDAVVIAIGCYVETRDEALLKEEGVDICIGNNLKGKTVEILENYLDSQNAHIYKDDLTSTEYENLDITESAEHTRAFIKVQDGCNQFCSYCIIPFARGRVRSRKAEDVCTEIQRLAEKGYREFIITGIHLSSYGTDFVYEQKKADQFAPDILLELLKSINSIPGVARIRLGSLEPRIITEHFVGELKKLDKLCHHFHLSLQSGSETVLKRMNRHYSASDYLESVRLLKASFDNPAITTDVIVGFPGETEEEFCETLEFTEKCGFYEMHIFKYSKRQGTVAAALKEQLTEKEKTERSHRLESLEKKMTAAYRELYKGKKAEVLFEEQKDIDGSRYWVGFTREYIKVACQSELINEGQVLSVMLGDYINNDYMKATPL